MAAPINTSVSSLMVTRTIASESASPPRRRRDAENYSVRAHGHSTMHREASLRGLLKQGTAKS